MNAPIPHAVLAPAAFQEIELSKITVSTTQMQVHRRATLDPEALVQLTENVKLIGVLEPILVRPTDKGYGLVAGERRFLAAHGAKLKTIPAMVRPMSDLQVIELQIIENDQREDLHELIEAEGFEELMKTHKFTAEQIADKVSRSRRYVFNRLKLLDLCPEARTAFLVGKINASVAILLARLPVHELQKKALKEVTQTDWEGEPMSARAAATHMQRHYMLRLADAPFDTKDAGLVAKAGPCGACPKRTGNQKDLFPDVSSADVCTDPSCFDLKKAAHADQLRKAAEAKGQTVISGKEAKAIKPHEHSSSLSRGFVTLDKQEYVGGKWQTLRKALGKDMPETALLQDPHDPTKLVEIVQHDRVVSSLKAKGLKLGFNDRSSSSGSSADRENERKARHETQVCRALFDAIHAKPIKIDHDLLGELAFFVYETATSYEHHEIIDPLHGLDDDKKQPVDVIAKMDDSQLARLLVDCMLVREIKRNKWGFEDGEAKSKLMEYVAKKAAVDVNAIRKPFQEAYDEREQKRVDREKKIKANAKKAIKEAAEKKPKATPAKKAKKAKKS